MSFNATVEPANRSESRLFEPVRIGVSRVDHVVQLHHDVGAYRGLDKNEIKFKSQFYTDKKSGSLV